MRAWSWKQGSGSSGSQETNPMEGHKGCKPAKHLIVEAIVAYRAETNEGIWKPIDDWEEEIKQEREPDNEIEI